MKRFVPVLLCLSLMGAIASCGHRNVDSPKARVSAQATKEGTPSAAPTGDAQLAKYKNGDYVVLEDFKCTAGESLWQDFYKNIYTAKAASVKLIYYYTLSGNMSKETYEQLKDEYPKCFIQELIYDGSNFTITSLSSTEKELDMSKQYKYLKKYAGEPSSPYATFSFYEYYVLVNDNTVTWEQIEHGMYSSQLGDAIDHHMVFEKLYD